MNYESPFSNRYGSPEMRGVWSEVAKRRAWRRVWAAVAQAQAAAGLVSPEAVDDLRAHLQDIDLSRAAEIEAVVGHDLQSELQTYAEQCPLGGPILHWGMTSADVQDNADIVRQRAALGLLLRRLREVLLRLAERIDSAADMVVLGYTHLQPAEPTTLGYRLSGYAQDLLACHDHLARLRPALRGKGIRGSVGTAATFVEMLAESDVTPDMLEATVLEALGIEAHLITTQTYPRLQDYRLLAGLAELAAALHKFAFDLRLMQSSAVGQVHEPFGEQQVGSSAMPFKRNPVLAERICSLARLVAAGAGVAWDNAATTLLERTLDDSANRRSIIPEAFLACDEMLLTAEKIVTGLEIDEQAAAEQLQVLGPLVATERLLTALVRAGADRQAMYERLRRHTRGALERARAGDPNPLPDRLAADTAILHFLQPARVRSLLDASTYVGQAPRRARQMAARLRERFSAG
ncbi:MAG: adenylosuccinate lyase [Chloroflexi bacterium RBG_13_68_17]|nr:MAG: adenylosuccinate lyase [Chloroflexi bacterium RBG_13_68_17]